MMALVGAEDDDWLVANSACLGPGPTERVLLRGLDHPDVRVRSSAATQPSGSVKAWHVRVGVVQHPDLKETAALLGLRDSEQAIRRFPQTWMDDNT